MPGYERNRFRELLPEQQYDFVCGICQDIVNGPVIVPCCRHLYCEECIKMWFNTSTTCPNDRRDLNPNTLSKPCNAFINRLAKLKIECDFASNGCEQICELDKLADHSRECQYNPKRKCANCGGIAGGVETCQIHKCSFSVSNQKSVPNNAFVR